MAFELLSGGDYASLTGNTVYSLNIADNDSPPADFNVGSVTTIASDATKVISGRFGLNNQGMTVTVPIANDPTKLDGGRIEIIAKELTETDDQYSVLATTEGASVLLAAGDLGKDKTLTIEEATLGVPVVLFP